MVLCYYKRVITILIASIFVHLLYPINSYASKVYWPGVVNLHNENITLNGVIPDDATSSNSKKGVLFTGDANEIFALGCGHIAVNVTLSGLGHTFIQYLKDLKKRNIKITVILINDKAEVGANIKKIPEQLDEPLLYMINFNAASGDWQKYNFERIVDDYGDIADNWIIGNEINTQTYNYYGPADIKEYTKVYCDTFKICYDAIKKKNENANVYISFDQAWDLPSLRMDNKKHTEEIRKYRYNTRDMLGLINTYLRKDVDWGVALHPYAAPLESAVFWDDEYAGIDINAKNDKDRPYLITLKNFEYALEYLKTTSFLKSDNTCRNVIISEFGVTSKDGEIEQAAAIYYLWKKIENNDNVKCLLYNSLYDLDKYDFGLISKKNRKRISWALYKDMDRPKENEWCKDLYDGIIEKNNLVEFSGFLFNKATVSELRVNE